jgi:hypothetical protein
MFTENPELGYGSDFIIDDADQDRLDKLPDLQREREINERRRKREILLQRYEFLRKQQLVKDVKKRQSSSSESDSSSESSESS